MTTLPDDAAQAARLAAPPALTVVVPCWNEAARLRPDVFKQALAGRPGWRFLFVDDGSTDATATVLQALAPADPARMRALLLPRNQGKAEAVRQGVLAALDEYGQPRDGQPHDDQPRDGKPHGGEAYVAFLDADLSTHPDELADMLADATASGALAVLGARVQLLGRRIKRNPARHYLGRVFATVASHTLGLAVYDTQCGAKLFRAGPDLASAFSRPFNSRWTFDVELLGRLLIRLGGRNALPDGRCAVIEHPLAAWTDVAGSKVRPWDFVVAIRELMRIRALLRDPAYRRLFAP